MKSFITYKHLTLALLTTLLFSCQKDEFLDTPQTKTPDLQVQGAIQLKNPYTVANMQKALLNVEKKQGKFLKLRSSSTTPLLKPSHYYIKFSPTNDEQEGIIKRDTTMFLFDYPLDWEFTEEFLANRPPLKEGEFPQYYTAVPVEKTLPKEVPHEVLEELYIPEEDPDFNTNVAKTNTRGLSAREIRGTNEQFLTLLLNEAYTLTENHDDILEMPNATVNTTRSDEVSPFWIIGSKWRPSGTIKIWDANVGSRKVTRRVIVGWEKYPCEDDGKFPPQYSQEEGYKLPPVDEFCQRPIYKYITETVYGSFVPLEGAQVLMRQWFTVRQGITNKDGYFSTGTVRGKAKYVIQWERYQYSIRNGSLFQAETKGPKVKKQAWNHNIKGGDDEYHGMIHTAAHTYYYGSRFGLTSPPTNATLKRQLKIAAREKNGTSSYAKARRIWFGADISLQAWGRTSASVFGTTIHELAHAAHRELDKSAYNNLVWDAYTSPCAPSAESCENPGPTGNNNRRLLETWATTVEIAFALARYKDKFNQPNYEYYENFQAQTINKKHVGYENHYTSAGWDMIDKINQRTHPKFGNSSVDYPIDRVSAYTLKQLEGALKGARYWTQWRNHIKDRYENDTEKYLDELFSNWKD